jgi:putative flippase GtrA|tara:strand:- start:1032 stop:1424 length:393 start_codon:yes stop_codon:yes gene_type:complete
MIIKIIKYAGTNGVAFVADFIVLVLLDTYTDIDRSYIAFFCYLLGTCVSFVLAKNFVFGRGWLADRPALEFSAYFLGGIIGAIITAVAFILLAAINVNNILVQKIIASVFSFTTVFIYRNFIVFNDDRNN